MELLKEMGRTDFSDVVLTEPLALDGDIAPIGIEQVMAQRTEIKAARAAWKKPRPTRSCRMFTRGRT